MAFSHMAGPGGVLRNWSVLDTVVGYEPLDHLPLWADVNFRYRRLVCGPKHSADAYGRHETRNTYPICSLLLYFFVFDWPVSAMSVPLVAPKVMLQAALYIDAKFQ
jgi:hypothetical protein